MVVILHQAVGETSPSEPVSLLLKKPQEEVTVARVAKHALLGVASRGHVMDSACKLLAR
jgi:hypothetical protein